jgi:hypothetical protein
MQRSRGPTSQLNVPADSDRCAAAPFQFQLVRSGDTQLATAFLDVSSLEEPKSSTDEDPRRSLALPNRTVRTTA